MDEIYYTIFFLYQVNISAQNVELLNGFEYYYGKVAFGDRSIARHHLGNTEAHQKVRISINPFKKKQVSIITSYHTVFPFVSMKLGNDDEIKNGPFIGAGSGKTRIHRVGIGAGYKMKFWKNRIILNPRIILNNEWAIRTWEPSSRSNSVGRYDYILYSYSNPGFQIVPEFDIPIYFKIYKGLYLQLDYSFLWGHRPFMIMDVDYTIEGVTQPQAQFYNDGTAHHYMFGLSYFFDRRRNDK